MPEIKGNFFVSLSYCLVALFFVTLFAASCEEEKSVSDGLIDGKCGLTGQRVECNSFVDCMENNFSGDYNCSIYGWCYNEGPYYGTCSVVEQLGTPCDLPVGSVCNIHGYCVFPCETHDDCENSMCSCEPEGEISYCKEYSCYEGECPDFTHPVMGTRICAPNDDFLEGECIDWSGTCKTGYEKVGELGCKRVDDGQ